MVERRRDPRIEVNWPIEIFVDNSKIEGIAKNITLKGMFISCEEPLSLKENYRISIFMPNNRSITVVGKAVWSTSYAMNDQCSPVCIGLSFIKISPEDSHTLKDMIQITTKV